MAARATWKPYPALGEIKEEDLPDSAFAFPRQRKEPLIDVHHLTQALLHIPQVDGVSDADREVAFANIKKAARYYGIGIPDKDWHDLIDRGA